MIRLAAIDHVVFRVADLEGTMRFYTDVLGAGLEKVQAEIGLYQLRARSASTPGSSLPSSHSRKAPPAVET